MIATLEGVLTERGTESVVEAGGLGLAVLLSAGDAERLPPVGQSVRLFTHLSVREDAWTLFGFLERETRTLYRLLLSVGGIGPKVALGMLSGATAAEIAAALHRGDEKALTRLPGVGKKSAARLVVELASKVPAELLAGLPAPGAAGAPSAPATPARATALAMLASMGLASPRADQVLDAAAAAAPELAQDPVAWVRSALKQLG
ncbi:MAG TPA: Holliday junction ATP-dependent DNA helicase RuvA [Candidatus Krumholzibacteria bacterium]|nr:Holliday junction ATP-dependent DNA helicase RuvA [Candidatus Krumholzibacteria bacterium]